MITLNGNNVNSDNNIISVATLDQIARFANIPEEFRERRQWANYNLVSRSQGCYNKAPLQPNGLAASTSDPSTWSTYDEVVDAIQQGHFYGIGLILTKDDPFVGIDLDNCLDLSTGRPFVWAAQILKVFSGYTEVSPSGIGLHIIGLGALPGQGRNIKPLEVYNTGRFLTFTGNVYDGRTAVEPWGENLAALYTAIKPLSKAIMVPSDEGGRSFARLFSGDTSAYGGDHSEADYGFVKDMVRARATDEQIVAALRLSGLWRDKDERPDYLERTIAAARQELGIKERGNDPQGEESFEWQKSKARESLNGPLSELLVPELKDLVVEALLQNDQGEALDRIYAQIPQGARAEKLFTNVLERAKAIVREQQFTESFAHDEYLFDATSALTRPLSSEELDIIEGIIPRGQIATWIGAGGSLKTAAAIYAGFCVVLGMPFCGMPVKTRCSVLLIATESDKVGMLRRLQATAKHYGISAEQMEQAAKQNHRFLIRTMEEMSEEIKLPGGQNVLADWLGKNNIGLVFLDTLSNVMVGDENSNRDMNAFCDAIRVITAQVGCAVVPLHHPSREGEKSRAHTVDGRGGNALRNASRSQCTFVMKDDIGTLTHTKSNESKRQPQQQYNVAVVSVLLENDEEVEVPVFNDLRLVAAGKDKSDKTQETIKAGSPEWRWNILGLSLRDGGLTITSAVSKLDSSVASLKAAEQKLGEDLANPEILSLMPPDRSTVHRDFAKWLEEGRVVEAGDVATGGNNAKLYRIPTTE